MNGRLQQQYRGSGRTTKQMLQAPQGALYIWVNDHLYYPKELAKELGRDDLTIISPNLLGYQRGRQYPAVILDHACRLNEGQFYAFQELLIRSRRSMLQP